MVKNLCSRKRTKNPNKCKKIRGCKVASGPKRTYCRKVKNKTKKTRKIRARVKSLKGGKRRSKKYRKRGGGAGCGPQPFVGAPYGSNLSELPGVSGPHDGNYYSLNKLDVQPQMNPISERTTFQAIDFKGGKRTRKSKKGRKYKTKQQKGGVTGLFQTIGHDFNSAYRAWQGEPAPANPLPYEDQIYFGNRMPDNLAYLKTKIHGE